MTRVIFVLSILLLAPTLAACGDAASDSQADDSRDFDESPWENAEQLTVRECTCQDIYGFTEPFEPWPALDGCLQQNADAIDRALELEGSEPFVINYLAPNIPPGAITEHWYVAADGSGVRRYERICDTSPEPSDCGWHSAPFEQANFSSSTDTVSVCGGERSIERLSVPRDTELRVVPMLGAR